METFLLGFIVGSTLFCWLSVTMQIRECADCAVGNIDRKWWRKAIMLAEFRKKEAEDVRGKE